MAANSDSSPLPGPGPSDVAGLLSDLLTLATTAQDPAWVCSGIAAGATGLPGVGAAGVLVAGTAGGLATVGASEETEGVLHLLETVAVSDAALDCLRSGHTVSFDPWGGDGSSEGEPRQVAGEARMLRSAYGLPLSTGAATLGVLHLFSDATLPGVSLAVARSLADVATLALLGADPEHDAAVVTRRLHQAIETRVTVEQAKGVLAARFALSPQQAFGRLVAAATATNRPLGSVATAVVERTTDATLDAALAAALPAEA